MSTAERILQKTIKRLTDELGHAEGQVMQERLRANSRVADLGDRLQAVRIILSVPEPLDSRSAEDLAKLRMDDIARLSKQVESLEDRQNRALLVISGGGPHRAEEAAMILRGDS